MQCETRVVCCALIIVSVVGVVFGSGLPKMSRSEALVSSCFQFDVAWLNRQTIAKAKERRRQIGPVKQTIYDLSSQSKIWHGTWIIMSQKVRNSIVTSRVRSASYFDRWLRKSAAAEWTTPSASMPEMSSACTHRCSACCQSEHAANDRGPRHVACYIRRRSDRASPSGHRC